MLIWLAIPDSICSLFSAVNYTADQLR